MKRPLLVVSILCGMPLMALCVPAPLDPLEPANGASVPEMRDGLILKWQQEPSAVWYEVYIQRDGMLIERSWMLGLAESGEVEYDFKSATVAAGQASSLIEWWVRPWEPVGGSGAWSGKASFTLTRVDLAALAGLLSPSSGTTMDGAWWDQLQADSTSSEATWFEFEVRGAGGGATVRKKWIERLPGVNFATTYYQSPDGGDPEFLLLDSGSYEWRVRQWSPSFGSSDWSAPQTFTVQNIDFSTPPSPPGAPTVSNADWLSFNAGDGNSPSVTFSVAGQVNQAGTWFRLWIGDAAGAKVFDKWFRYVEANGGTGFCTMEVTSPLLLGAKNAYIQTYNASGSGAWSNPIPFVIPQNSPGDVTNIGVNTTSLDGALTVQWDTPPGIDWFQVWIACEGRVIHNKWLQPERVTGTATDYVQRVSFDGITNTGTAELVTQSPIICGGNYEVWVRSYANTGEYTQWVQTTGSSPATLNTKPAALISTVFTDRVALDWGDATTHGFYELVIWRNGKKYFSTTIRPQFSSSAGTDVLLSEYETFWMPASGSYQFWVRSGVGGTFSSWSDPSIFVVP